MKKTYETPSVEKIAFQYRDQVVAASGFGGSCTFHYENSEGTASSSCVISWDGPSGSN